VPSPDKPPASPRKTILTLVILFAVMGAGLWFARKLEAPGQVDLDTLNAVGEAVLVFHQHKGQAPESLDVLYEEGYLETPAVDRLGNPILYHLTEENAVELTNTGADGKVGGHMFKADTTISFQLPEK
jgi:hypothetical protein